jgi:glycosyltransferase involved in cell wall biosynthesis
MTSDIPAVSIIVPVYKTERYLDKCLQSLIAQTLEEIEIIVVNDGSPDGSQSIIDRYAREYPDKITALYQENQGLGPARNLGINNAQGKYVGFVDSDDWVDPDMYRQMYAQAYSEDCDVVICDMVSVREHDGENWVTSGYRGDNPAPRTIADFVMASMNAAWAMNKLYRRSLFDIAHFPAVWYEDIGTTPILLSYARRIAYLRAPLYFYLQRDAAITAQRDNPRNIEVIQAWERSLLKANETFRKEIAYAVYSCVKDFVVYRSKYRAEYLKFLINNNDLIGENILIQQDIASKTDIFSILLRFLTTSLNKDFRYYCNSREDLNSCLKNLLQNYSAPKLIRRIIKIRLREFLKKI